MATFVVTVKRTIITKIVVSKPNKKSARAYIEDYGPDLAAVDMSAQDEVSAKIVSVNQTSH